jgi:hypothetical protein
MKMVIAGGKYDGPDVCRLKLHEEYGRVWLYMADAEGRSISLLPALTVTRRFGYSFLRHTRIPKVAA